MIGGTDETHDPSLISWVEGATDHLDFPIQNLPFGIFSVGDSTPRPGVAIGDHILDLTRVASLLPAAAANVMGGQTLNALLALPCDDRRALRHRLSELLSDGRHRDQVEPALNAAAECTLHLPCAIGDYTDFYVGIHHANNIGRQFRPDNPLLPNYKWVPIGYHGRASSVRQSGVPVLRPNGQHKAPDSDSPAFGPSQRLDYELELGVWVGQGNPLGTAIPIREAERHVAGFCLLNDWSARDLQAWEYQPLGPFLAKSFQSTISPWVVTAEALAPFRAAQSARQEGDPHPLPYLWDERDQQHGELAIDLEVHLVTQIMRDSALPPYRLSHGLATNMYWTVAQMVAHHTSNGCNLRPGDLLGTGTISAPTEDGFGSLMEITRGGTQPIELPTGEKRSFLDDGDEIILSATARAEGFRSIGFGACRAVVLPALGAP
ncbi:MAG: fumarylacetoacetase [Sphingobium sp.]|uniref:fumarylacetoacetase n=1 Tax=Sphingobium sp. TaxID=1912891 RepID=UPI0029AC5F00|nr:fumarylacetoacetase [Sphingobium sp.]MDX3909278.1 fumarylacetoacetase [Sphingobium sp.]